MCLEKHLKCGIERAHFADFISKSWMPSLKDIGTADNHHLKRWLRTQIGRSSPTCVLTSGKATSLPTTKAAMWLLFVLKDGRIGRRANRLSAVSCPPVGAASAGTYETLCGGAKQRSVSPTKYISVYNTKGYPGTDSSAK